eukprot:176943-Pyramimonas_sp.AAC.1
MAKARHVLRNVLLAPGAPGMGSVEAQVAVFEHLARDGYIHVDFQALTTALNIEEPAYTNASQWFHKRAKAWDVLGRKFGLCSSMRRPQPFAEREGVAQPDRCLLFTA